MKLLEEDDLMLRKYLLEELSPEEQSEVEERLFLEAESFQQLQMVEDELIDDYVYGELSPKERERFDNIFLTTPERHESLRVAQALSRYTPENAATATQPKKTLLHFFRPRHRVLKFSLAAALILIALGGLWLIIKTIRRTSEPVQVQTPPAQKKESPAQPTLSPEEQRTRSLEEPESETAQTTAEQHNNTTKAREVTVKDEVKKRQPRSSPPPDRQAPAQVATAMIYPIGAVRGEGEGGNKITLSADAEAIDLQLPLLVTNSYASYQAKLSKEGGRAILTRKTLKPTTYKGQQIILMRVPVKFLRPQKYRIMLYGLTPDGILHELRVYPFQVTAR